MPGDQINKKEILEAAKRWFRETIAPNHIANTEKLVDPKEFNINPFLVSYLANFLTGNRDPINIAKALVYPRVLGTSIATSFGQNSQKFTNEVLKSLGSTTSGIDIEFMDQIDKRKKYCQLKAGPNNINKDDVETIHNHFSKIKNLARTNNLKLSIDDMIVGVLYGEPDELSTHYRALQKKHNYPVFVGQEFWWRLTGDKEFYFELGQALSIVAEEFDSTELLSKVIKELSESDVVLKLSGKIK